MVALITATVSSNGLGTVVAADVVMAKEAVTNAGKALETAAFGEVTVMDVLGATSGLDLKLVEAAEDVKCTKMTLFSKKEGSCLLLCVLTHFLANCRET